MLASGDRIASAVTRRQERSDHPAQRIDAHPTRILGDEEVRYHGGSMSALGTASDTFMALSMTVGRGKAARKISQLAMLKADDRVVDVGCGPGTAVREAARTGAVVTGVDPSAIALRLGRWINSWRKIQNVTLCEGTAEALPLPDDNTTVIWSLSAVHHWRDRRQGLREAHRVLAAGGRLLLAERLVKPGSHGHAAHGLTRDGAQELAAIAAGAGFHEVRVEEHTAGRRRLLVVRGVK
jgi:SAM-dependent methyltransferase